MPSETLDRRGRAKALAARLATHRGKNRDGSGLLARHARVEGSDHHRPSQQRTNNAIFASSNSLRLLSMIFARPAPRHRTRLLLALVTAATLSSACSKDKLKAALSATPPEAIDYGWVRDSTLMASKPNVLFRVLETTSGTQVVPIATIGTAGFTMMSMRNRGWHFFDLTYLHEGSVLRAIRDGRDVGNVTLARGQWESGKPSLDSIPGCQIVVPGGVATVPSGVRIVMSGAPHAMPSAQALGAGELQEALDRAFKLVVPSAGVSPSMLPRYTREIHQVPAGAGPKPTIVVILDDPEIVPEDLPIEGQRPRHVVLVLDNARFGYKVTFQYTTVGNKKSPPRYEWLDFVDVDADGKGELLFGIRGERYKKEFPTYTIGLHFKNDVWTQSLTYNSTRCQG